MTFALVSNFCVYIQYSVLHEGKEVGAFIVKVKTLPMVRKQP